MNKNTTVGSRIRSFRERLDMTVSELARKCGVNETVINAIEKDEVLPALGVLTKISRSLGQRLGTFMDDQFKPDPIITRSSTAGGEREDFNTLGYASVSLAEGKPDRHMDPFRITFAANGSEDPSSHEGEELIICTEGEIELTYGSEKQILRPGDTAYYNSVVKHSLRALGGKSASIFGVVFMPF